MQVITISPTGAISGLQHHSKLDLTRFGQAIDAEIAVVRATEISWHSDGGWFITFTDGPNKGKPLTYLGYLQYRHKGCTTLPPVVGESEVAIFDSYDTAIRCEIEVLTFDRLTGNF